MVALSGRELGTLMGQAGEVWGYPSPDGPCGPGKFRLEAAVLPRCFLLPVLREAKLGQGQAVGGGAVGVQDYVCCCCAALKCGQRGLAPGILSFWGMSPALWGHSNPVLVHSPASFESRIRVA